MKRNFLFCIILCVILCSCAPDKNSGYAQNNFPIELKINENDLNTSFSIISEPILDNSYTNGSPLFLSLINKTEDKIVINYSEGINFYYYNNSQWEKIDNIVIYPEDSFILLPKSEVKSYQYIITSPEVKNMTNSLEVYAILIGSIPEENGKQVYSDYRFILYPEN